MAYPLNIFPIRFSVGFSVSEPPSTIDDQICPVCDLSPGSNVRTDSQQPALELPFPRKVETALFYHKPHLDLPGMRTGTQPVLRKEKVATWCIFDYFCVLERILHTIIAHTLYVLKKALAERFKTKCWLQTYGKPSLHQLWGIAVAAVACSLVVAIAPWQIILDGWHAGLGNFLMPPKFVVLLEGVAPNQPGLRAHWGLALSRSVCAF